MDVWGKCQMLVPGDHRLLGVGDHDRRLLYVGGYDYYEWVALD